MNPIVLEGINLDLGLVKFVINFNSDSLCWSMPILAFEYLIVYLRQNFTWKASISKTIDTNQFNKDSSQDEHTKIDDALLVISFKIPIDMSLK